MPISTSGPLRRRLCRVKDVKIFFEMQFQRRVADKANKIRILFMNTNIGEYDFEV